MYLCYSAGVEVTVNESSCRLVYNMQNEWKWQRGELNEAYLISSWSKVEASKHARAEYIVGAGVRLGRGRAFGSGVVDAAKTLNKKVLVGATTVCRCEAYRIHMRRRVYIIRVALSVGGTPCTFHSARARISRCQKTQIRRRRARLISSFISTLPDTVFVILHSRLEH
jgi:hypothetical protein